MPTREPPLPDLDLWGRVCMLSPMQRAAVVLHHYEDLPEAEIAECLGCSVGSVKTRLRRTLRRLRQDMTVAAMRGG